MSTKKSSNADLGQGELPADQTPPEKDQAPHVTTEPDAIDGGPSDRPLTGSPDAPTAEAPPDLNSPAIDPEAAERKPDPYPETIASAEDDGHAAQTEHVYEEEERGWSFAARALVFLLVLLGGAALGVWAAPKLAPMLPAGLAPVSAWLTPGQAEADAEIAALEARLDSEIEALNGRVAALPDAAALQSETAGSVSAVRTELSGEIDALRTDLAQATSGNADERLGQLETAVDGARAELASLKDQITARAATLSDDAAASIDTYRAELDGLKAEVGTLSGAVSSLSGRLDEVAASAEARVAEAQAQAEQVEQAATAERDLSLAQSDLAQIRAALANGQPFEEPLNNLAASAGVTPPEGLAAAAATGVATPEALRAAYGDAAHQAIRASIRASAGDGLVARSRAFFESQVASRSLTPQEGQTPDAVLSRIDDAMRRNDLDAALAEVDQLPTEAQAALEGWIASAKQRADAEAGLEELSASISTLN